MEKTKSNDLLRFLQERCVVPIEVTVNGLDEEKFPEILVSGNVFSVRFKFHRNGRRATVQSHFADKDCSESKRWIRAIKATILTAVIGKAKGKDIKYLEKTRSHDEKVLSCREQYLYRFPYLEMPTCYNISNNICLSEDMGICLLKNYVGGGC